MILRASALSAAVVTAAIPAGAMDVALALPPGASVVADTQSDFARLSLPVAPAVGGEVDTALLEGELTRTAFQIADAPTLDQLMAQVRVQFVEAGARVLLDCTTQACGGFDFRQAVDTFPPPEMVVDLGGFGFLAVRDPETETVTSLLASVVQGTGYVQVTRLRPVPVSPAQGAEDPVPVALPGADAVQSEATPFFAGRGSVVLEGLAFDTGSATLSDAEYPGLQALAEFLQASPEARVTLVGHTDAEGALAPNLALSRERAAAVRDRLVEGFGVDPAQLTADGVGYLAPRATNTTRDGRLLNRRVEAVLTAP